MKFVITKSPNNMDCIEIEYPVTEIREFLKRIILANHINDPDYIAKSESTPFLQCDSPTYLLIEFWGREPQTFVDYINDKWRNRNVETSHWNN